MKRAEPRRAWSFAVLGLLIAAISGWALWVRRDEAPAGALAPPPSAASTRGAPRLGASAPRTPTHASVAGRITDPAGAPVAGAAVCASVALGPMSFEQGEPTCASAAEDGRYQITGLSPARFTLVASAPGHRPMSYTAPAPERARWLDLRAGEARAGVDFTLARGGVEARGQVKDVGGGPIAGALVTIRTWLGPLQGASAARTDGQGFFSVWLCEGPFIASASADGYSEGWKDGAAPGPVIEILLTPGSVLEGRVIEAGTGEPVAGARVDPGLDQGWGPSVARAVSSDEEGRFRLEGLAPGRYKPVARAPGVFGQARERVLLGVGQTSSEVVIEVRPTPSVAGRVQIAPGSEPCTSGHVGLTRTTGGGMLHAVIEADGSARFDGVLAGSYQVMVSCLDRASEPTYPPVEVGDADIEGLVWTVRVGVSIRGRVVDRQDRPVRAAVHAVPVDGERVRLQPGAFTQNEDDGSFALRGLLPGKHRVMAHAPDHVPPEPVEVELVDGRAPGGNDVTLVVDSGGTIEGTVTDEDRRPKAGAEIMIMGQQPGTGGRSVKTLGDGSFTLKGLVPGDYRVWAVQGGSSLWALAQVGEGAPGVPATVKAGATARVHLVVKREEGEIAGRVVDEGGKPVTDAFIDAHPEPEGAPRAPGGAARPPLPPGGMWSSSPVLTDSEGEFVIGNLSRGTYTVQAYRRGGGSALVEHVKVGDTVTLTIQQTGTLSGTLAGPGGAPPDQFTISIVNQAAPFFRNESFVFTSGAWSLSDLPPGKYQLSAEAPEGTATAEVELAQGEQRSGVTLTLASRVAIQGQVVSLQDGAPLAGMSVRAFPNRAMAPPSPMQEHHVTDGTGRFQMDEVPAGPLMIMIMPNDPMKSEHDPAMVPIEGQPGAVTDVGRIPLAKRRMKPGDPPGDLGFSLKVAASPADFATGPREVAVVRPDGPAAAAGLQVGDVIVSVDGHDVTGKLGYLYGSLTHVPEGTKVTLGLARGASAAIVAAKLPPFPDSLPPVAIPAPPAYPAP